MYILHLALIITRLPKVIMEQVASADPLHHPKLQLRRLTHFNTTTPQTPHCAPRSSPKLPPPIQQSPNPTTCLIQPTIPIRIHIRSAVLPQCTGQTDTHTHRSTDGWRECLITIGHFCSIESNDMALLLLIVIAVQQQRQSMATWWLQ